MRPMWFFSDFLHFKECVKTIYYLKGSDPDSAGIPVSSVLLLEVLSEILAPFQAVVESPLASLEPASLCLQLGEE